MEVQLREWSSRVCLFVIWFSDSFFQLLSWFYSSQLCFIHLAPSPLFTLICKDRFSLSVGFTFPCSKGVFLSKEQAYFDHVLCTELSVLQYYFLTRNIFLPHSLCLRIYQENPFLLFINILLFLWLFRYRAPGSWKDSSL